jgi:hypothetical protein
MTNELAKVEKTNAIIEMGPTGGLLPRNFEGLWRMATIMASSGFMPKGMERIEAVFVAVQLGLEIGLSPMQAVQNIASINGRPCVWGDAVIGLVEASGLMESMKEFFDGEAANYPDTMTAVCIVKRKGGREVTQKFSVADAKRAGLWDKQGPWKQYPRRMLQMRARGFALRDLFPDVLKGLKTAEEVMDYDQDLVMVNGTYQSSTPPVAELPTGDNSHLYKAKKASQPVRESSEVIDPPESKTEPDVPKNEPSPQVVNLPDKESLEAKPEVNGVIDEQKRIDDHFRSKWVNLQKPGFADFVHKNHMDFANVSDEVKAEARAKWAKFYPTTKFPKCIALKTEEPPAEAGRISIQEPPAAETGQGISPKINLADLPEYKDYMDACEIDPSLALKYRVAIMGSDIEPATPEQVREIVKAFNRALDEAGL